MLEMRLYLDDVDDYYLLMIEWKVRVNGSVSVSVNVVNEGNGENVGIGGIEENVENEERERWMLRLVGRVRKLKSLSL